MPGSFELPLIAKAMAASGKYDAVLAIGAVVCRPAMISRLDMHVACPAYVQMRMEPCCLHWLSICDMLPSIKAEAAAVWLCRSAGRPHTTMLWSAQPQMGCSMLGSTRACLWCLGC